MNKESRPPDGAIRQACRTDRAEFLRMRTALWPDSTPAEVDELLNPGSDSCGVLVAGCPGGELTGFVEVGLRNSAEGCTTSPVGYLEGVWVDRGARRSGIGRALVAAGERWVRQRGCTEFASDCAFDNAASIAFHAALGFGEVGRVVCFRKPCVGGESSG